MKPKNKSPETQLETSIPSPRLSPYSGLSGFDATQQLSNTAHLHLMTNSKSSQSYDTPSIDAPYSGLLHSPLEDSHQASVPRRPTRIPWWWNPLAILAQGAILAYQHIIPSRMKRQCIYTPSCSRYCQRAICKYGLLRGLLYFRERWSRCNAAYSLGGLDEP